MPYCSRLIRLFIHALLAAAMLAGESVHAENQADSHAGFAARAADIHKALTTRWAQPFPNFSNAQMHYYATALALLQSDPRGINHPALTDGDPEAKRPPLRWGVLKYDGEATDTPWPQGRGNGPHSSFAWQPSLYHFNFPGLAALMGLYPDLPVWDQPHHRDPSVSYRERYLTMVLQRSDNFNAFTGEGTENHINMSRPTGWVMASEAARLGIEPDGALLPAAARKQQMKAWMQAWAQQVYRVGIGEWDSSIYHGVSLQGWFVAHAYAATAHGHDPEVRAIAEAVIHYYAASLALKNVNFQMGGAEMRGGSGYQSLSHGTDYLAWLWFADADARLPETVNGSAMAEIVYATLSDYRPPAAIVELARKPTAQQAQGSYRILRPDYLLQDPQHAVEIVHLADDFLLGSANISTGRFFNGNWQIVPWKLMAYPTAEEDAFPLVFGGNGGFHHAARINAPDPWMQTVQHGATLLQMHRVPANAQQLIEELEAVDVDWRRLWLTDFEQRWPEGSFDGFQGKAVDGKPTPIRFLGNNGSPDRALLAYVVLPENIRMLRKDDWLLLQAGRAYVALRAFNGEPMQLAEDGSHVSVRGQQDKLFGWIIEVSGKSEFATLDDFADAIVDQTSLRVDQGGAELHFRNLKGEDLQAAYAISGSWTEPAYDMNFGVTTPNGIALMHSGDWRQPEWPSGKGHGRQPTWSINGSTVHPEQWPTIHGPALSLAGGVLQVWRDGQIGIQVDFSGDLPKTSGADAAAGAAVDRVKSASD